MFRKQQVTTQVLAASVRDVFSVTECFYHGAHIVTMPPGVFEKMYGHVLTDKGLQLFDDDYKKTLANLLGEQ